MSITQKLAGLKRRMRERPLTLIVIDENGKRLGGGDPPTDEELKELGERSDVIVIQIVRKDEEPNPDDLPTRPRPISVS